MRQMVTLCCAEAGRQSFSEMNAPVQLLGDDEVGGKGNQRARSGAVAEQKIGENDRYPVDRKQQSNPNGCAPQVHVLRFGRSAHRHMVFEMFPGQRGSRQMEKKTMISVLEEV